MKLKSESALSRVIIVVLMTCVAGVVTTAQAQYQVAPTESGRNPYCSRELLERADPSDVPNMRCETSRSAIDLAENGRRAALVLLQTAMQNEDRAEFRGLYRILLKVPFSPALYCIPDRGAFVNTGTFSVIICNVEVQQANAGTEGVAQMLIHEAAHILRYHEKTLEDECGADRIMTSVARAAGSHHVYPSYAKLCSGNTESSY